MHLPPVLGEELALRGQRVAPGVVSLDWDDVDDATGYELMARSADEWVLLGGDDSEGELVAVFEGSSARVGGLPVDADGYWFAVRARGTAGVSRWSSSLVVEAAAGVERLPPLFDPFTAPTLSDIDLERLGAAAATVTPGQADCSAVPALDVPGISVVDAPSDLSDSDAASAVAEIVRIAGGCVVVEYVALEGRTVAQIRSLLADEASVHAVSEPMLDFSVDHEYPPSASDHASASDTNA